MKNEVINETNDIAKELDLDEDQLDEVSGGRMSTKETGAKTSDVTKCCW